jgi:hypothetical protein
MTSTDQCCRHGAALQVQGEGRPPAKPCPRLGIFDAA